MKSRMEKYYKDEDILQRTTRNDTLYEELYREKQTPSSNVTVLDNVDEIDINKIREMVNSRENYKKMRKYENLVNSDTEMEKAPDYEFDIIDDSNYDINEILQKKKEVRTDDNVRVRKITNIEYTTSNVVLDDDEDEMSTDFLTQEKKLRNLTETVSEKSSFDLFANLKDDGTDNETDCEPEKKEDTFYTSTKAFTNEDFKDEDDDEESSGGGKALVIITIIALLIAAGIFVWFKFFK